MIGTVRYTVVLIVLSMLFKLCHLITHPQTTMTINVDPSETYHVLKTFSTSFSHKSFKNFSLFHVVTNHQRSSLFAVCNSDTIVELSVKDMKLIKVYKTDFCNHLPKYQCEDAITINLLSEINLFREPMVWFCYIPQYHYLPSPITGHCLLPKNNIISTDITWTKRGYTSTNHNHRTFSIQTKPYIFIGTQQQNSLVILRTMLPKYDGKIDSSFDLVTPMAEFYFERNSRFLAVFATKYEVYYVIEEPLVASSQGNSECQSSSDIRSVINTRLLKVCKDDPGTTHQDSERNFGTAAKADIVCPIGSNSEQYLYTRAISASWSGDRLYIIFDSQKNSPPGKVLCVYDKFSFDGAFNSEMVPPKMFAAIRIGQPIEDLCRKLGTKTLSDREKEEASSMSVNGLYRLKSVSPIRSVPVMKLGNNTFHTLTAFRASPADSSTVIVLSEDHFLRLVLHLDDYGVCHLSDIRLEADETINNVKGDSMESNIILFVSTTKRMIQMDIAACEKYPERMACVNQAPNLCGWDTRQGRCTILTDDVERNYWQRSDCRNYIRTDDRWSVPERCRVNNGPESLSCVCRYCVSETGCEDGQRVDISGCVAVPNTDRVNVFDDWGPWSECVSSNQYQKRIRKCRGSKCTGELLDYRRCSNSSISETTSNWTQWYKTDNDKYRVSFRTKCTKNNLKMPAIEGRQKVCIEACDDSSSVKWSDWSQCIETNIQYRLLNCSFFDECPQTQFEVKSCPLRSIKYRNSKGTTTGSYTTIHIALAVLATSLVWFIILTSVCVALFRYNYHYRRRSKPTFTKSRSAPPRGISGSVYGPLFPIHPQSVMSETSNDYLSSGLNSPLYAGTSLSGTIHSVHRINSSNDSFTFI